VAIVCNSIPPYRLHVHQRIAREVPEIRLRTIMTHEEDGRWPFIAPPDIGLVSFGKGESCWDQTRPRYALHEWKKAASIISWAEAEKLSAMILLGYGDAGRVRLIAWCRRRGVPCFIWGDSNIRDDTGRGVKAVVKKAILSRLLRAVTGVLACGRLGRDFFARYGVPRHRMFAFPVEPDYDQIRDLTPDRVEEARRQFNLVPGRRRIIYSGRLVPEKRVDLLIDAFARVAADRLNWDLHIFGDGPIRAELEGRVPPALRARVNWPRHVSDPTMVFGIYRASDVLVLPSDREPWALVINEAVASGMAVVSSDVPGASAELVRDGENGRIFPAGDLAMLAQCLLDVTRPDKIDAMKGRSAAVLADWQREGDPIQGLRNALRFARVLV
jgi:glycosyltransferase involved in cell wall biosynthesis